MEAIPVVIKHQGKRYDVELEPNTTGEVFKFQLYSLTGVEPERQKILIKGGQLKNDTDLSSLGLKAGHLFMMMGTPSVGEVGADALQAPKEKTRFVEDMTDAEMAKVEGAIPAGLQNLGNTCYLNSTLQTLRAVPELQTELAKYKRSTLSSSASDQGFGSMGPSIDLTASLRELYRQMSDTQEGFPPLMFLNALRTAFPQFAQKSKTNNGYAQQDAEEAWSQILSQLRQKLMIKNAADPSTSSNQEISFIDKYFAGQFDTVTECDDVQAKEAGEEAVKAEEAFLKLNCHIGLTNHLRDGILAGLEEKIEKKSSLLDRDCIYTKKSQISRLPKYLTVHFIRFFWKRSVQKKAKIMRKVTFPQELDVVEFCTEKLQKRLVPVRDRIREVRKDELDMERARKRQKRLKDEEDASAARGPANSSSGASNEPDKANKDSQTSKDKKKTGADADVEVDKGPHKTDAEIEAERTASLLAAKKEIVKLVDPELAADDGGNKTGLYELRGVIAHQGSSADSGHYTAFIKKEGLKNPETGKRGEEDGKWWWFNDDRVSEVESEKIDGLSGGGESHSALILLYRAISTPDVEEA
ncbi:MAG: deubiquitinating enzyme [Phylliscum demangeonii]|nr:MAG: deubiquitinating enzyme [Phylliscum demangeonii]